MTRKDNKKPTADLRSMSQACLNRICFRAQDKTDKRSLGEKYFQQEFIAEPWMKFNTEISQLSTSGSSHSPSCLPPPLPLSLANSLTVCTSTLLLAQALTNPVWKSHSLWSACLTLPRFSPGCPSWCTPPHLSGPATGTRSTLAPGPSWLGYSPRHKCQNVMCCSFG